MSATTRSPRSGLGLPPLGVGTAPIAGMDDVLVPEEQATATLQRAIQRGIRYIDTAPHYGLGVGEERTGRAVQHLPRDTFVLSTKVGRLLRPLPPGMPSEENFPGAPRRTRVFDWSRDGIHRSLEESLTRLRLDRVDIAYLHDPDLHERDVYETGYPALAELKDQGVVRAIGVGMNQAEMPTRFVERLDLDLVLIASRYTLADQRALDTLLPSCIERGVGVIAAGVFRTGGFTDPIPGSRASTRHRSPQILAHAGELAAVCARYGVPLRAAALQFPFAHPAVATVLVGMQSPAEVDENMHLLQLPIPCALWQELKELGLLAAHAPVPEDRVAGQEDARTT